MKNTLIPSLFLFIAVSAFLLFAGSCENEENKPEIPVVSTTDITEITQTTAMGGGNITSDGGAGVSARGICWDTQPNPEISDRKTADGTGTGSFTSNLGLLSPDSTYYVRAYATNSAGTAYGNQVNFTTEKSTKFTDSRDGNVYETVKIGTQVWMKENLKYLPEVSGPTTYSQYDPVYYVYDYEGSDVSIAKQMPAYKIYGALYNWEAANSACPEGWHLPSDAEWSVLTTYLGGVQVAGGKLKETGTEHWDVTNTQVTNESGFTALPGGFRYSDSTFYYIRGMGRWWSATEQIFASTDAWNRSISAGGIDVYLLDVPKKWGLSVRCVKD